VLVAIAVLGDGGAALTAPAVAVTTVVARASADTSSRDTRGMRTPVAAAG
jgi:hypothetical protein